MRAESFKGHRAHSCACTEAMSHMGKVCAYTLHYPTRYRTATCDKTQPYMNDLDLRESYCNYTAEGVIRELSWCLELRCTNQKRRQTSNREDVDSD